MTTLQSILVAGAVLVTCAPAAMYFKDRAGIPDYGCNPDQKLGWTVLFVLTIFPAAMALVWLGFAAWFA